MQRTYITWTERLSLGIDEIDNQHQLLVDVINRVYDALIRKARREECSAILEELVRYTHVHFAVEESIFRITHYPEYERHKHHHEALKLQVQQKQQAYARGDIDLDLELMAFLRRWLEDHILGEDARYVEHLLQSGLKSRYSKPSWKEKLWATLAT